MSQIHDFESFPDLINDTRPRISLLCLICYWGLRLDFAGQGTHLDCVSEKVFTSGLCLNLLRSPLDFARLGVPLHPAQENRVPCEYLAEQRMLGTECSLGGGDCTPEKFC